VTDMLILGIDPGLATTGYGLVQEQDGNLSLLDCGTITTRPGLPAAMRLQRLHEELGRLLDRWKPEAAAVEELFFSSNAKTAMLVGQARGVVLLTLSLHGLQVYEYTPMQIKQALVGYGAAGKSQIQRMVAMLLDLPEVPKPDDAADAVATAICHLHSARMTELLASHGNPEEADP
jgi:crossover junction endodeoxyribonuclease RuvC